MKYKTLSPVVRKFVEYQIESWPENKQILADINADKMPRIISSYGKESKGSPDSGVYRPTEDAALRLIKSTMYYCQLELSVNAVESVYLRLSPEDQEFIRLMYWSKTKYTPDGIALKMNMTKTTVYRRLSLILFEVARRLGYANLWEGLL